MNLTPYQQVMVLNLLCDGAYYDCKGIFIKKMDAGRYKGFYKIEVNTADIYVGPERLMKIEDYFKIYNENKANLPANAAKRLYFLES